MDFIVSYQLYNKIVKKRKNNNNMKELEFLKEKEPIFQTCNLCGQYIYSCQCETIKLQYFNPEKSIY